MKRTICYCFGYSEADIMEDVLKNGGRSLIMERIRSEKRLGGCRCAEKNPNKR